MAAVARIATLAADSVGGQAMRADEAQEWGVYLAQKYRLLDIQVNSGTFTQNWYVLAKYNGYLGGARVDIRNFIETIKDARAFDDNMARLLAAAGDKRND
jgi:hypothetical protein